MRFASRVSSYAFFVATCLCAMPALGQQAVSPRAGEVPSVRKPARDVTRQVTPPVKEVVAEAEIPANVFDLDDRAIIVVGGKQRRAGEIKRELNVELERLSGPPVTARSISRPTSQPAPPTPEQLVNVVRPPRPRPAPVTGQPRSKDVAARTGPSPDLQARQGPTATEMIEYCNKNPAKITRVTGVLTPGGRVTVDGECFGEKTGQALAFGQFAGGNLQLSFERWFNHRIVAVVPAVKGAADHPVQLTVVRADSTRTPAAQADFVATRERVVVPGHSWTPTEKFDQSTTVSRGGSPFTSIPYLGGTGSRVTPFKVSINKACALDSAEWTGTAGRVDAFKGWESGPPHEADVEVVWTPVCTEKIKNYFVAVDKHQVCRIAFDLKAWAQCPIGVSP